jgi:hypothetical protein
VDPHALGPGAADVGMEWQAFLEVIAEVLETEPSFLFVDSMEWRWVKLANSMFLPLRSRLAYLSMIKQLKAPPKNVSGSYIIVRMDEPVKKPIDRTKVSCPMFNPSLRDLIL